MIRSLTACLLVLLAGCTPEPRVFTADSFPDELSAWGLVTVNGDKLTLHESTTAYDLSTPLFTDYAHKLRTLWTPAGTQGEVDAAGIFHLPVGSVISKTFYYPRRGAELVHTTDSDRHFNPDGLDLGHVYLLETRLLVRLEDGWHGLPYVWNEDQTEATLEITGAVMPVAVSGLGEFNYIVPDFNQCQGCHVTDLKVESMQPIGLKARHVAKPYSHLHQTQDQLTYLAERHDLLVSDGDYEVIAAADNESLDLEQRARGYLDINCGHCHSPTGAADTSGMLLNIEESEAVKLGRCKPPIAAGQGTGGHLYGIDPGNSTESILVFRMQSLDPGAMMPELGRSLVHAEGVELISAWIDGMTGTCAGSAADPQTFASKSS